ncbi:MAG: hypothetical protein XD60_1702 [Acetothermia bacterium 64_32]|nr:MAG: hypothetical protein XD60_1702 [Acetothermia bacterium 64_32]
MSGLGSPSTSPKPPPHWAPFPKGNCTPLCKCDGSCPDRCHSTVTVLARFLGWSTSVPRSRAMW